MPPRATPVSADKIAELLAEKGGCRIAIVLMIAAGLRRGETLGLRWRNVDLDRAKIKIVEQRVPLDRGAAHFADPKAAASVRTITLPPEAVDELRTTIATYMHADEADDEAAAATAGRLIR